MQQGKASIFGLSKNPEHLNMEQPTIPRDISWLKFNHRVLQEAQDPSVPLYERIKFLAIFSSNLDEFFRVRVSYLRSFKQLKKKTREKLKIKPKKILKDIQKIVDEQQRLFGAIYRNQILPALNQEGIHIINETQFLESHEAFARHYFEHQIQPLLAPISIKPDAPVPFLKNNALYLVVQFQDETAAPGILEIPVKELGRYEVMPAEEDKFYVAFLDDLIRFNLPDFYKDQTYKAAYAIKLSRDAELYIGDEFSGNLVDKIQRGLHDRDVGLPTRFLYDESMPEILLDQLIEIFGLQSNDLVMGARYHNFADFIGFPDPKNAAHLHNEPMPALVHPVFEKAPTLINAIWEKDQIVHFPYQKYDYVPQLIEEAAKNPDVHAIKITLYRVASQSAITEALLNAIKEGKKVVVFIEVKARFDEASNIYWGQRLTEAGARVIYSYPAIKVHTKLLHIQFSDSSEKPDVSYIGTGNFNEKTAKLYCDHALLTAHPTLNAEVSQVFELLEGRLLLPQTSKLLIAPYSLRQTFTRHIDHEIELAQAGRPGHMILKMNSLEDPGMIQKLYEASQAGVRVELIVRGICCLEAGIPGLSENISIISIIDRFLEHARIYYFSNNGLPKLYLSSADWMTRNLDRRVEVAVPIFDQDVQNQLLKLLELQLQDNTKARLIDISQNNPMKEAQAGETRVRAQTDFYSFLKQLGQ